MARYKNSQMEGPGYLNGEYSSGGWWSYFVLALCMKTTLPMLALAAAGVAALAWPRTGWDVRTLAAYVLLPAIGWVTLVTALTRAQIGLRYILPAIPFLCVLGWLGQARWLAPAPPGAAAIRSRARALGPIAAAGLLVWHAWSAVSIHPYHLAYFNEAAGGPSRGYRHLVDSNLDWGQDLIGLRTFIQKQGLTRINLYYFGTADPEYYGIQRAVPPEPGLYAVSATHLMGVYLPDRDYLAPFRQMTPTATIGHSILVYRLDRVPDFLKTPIRRP